MKVVGQRVSRILDASLTKSQIAIAHPGNRGYLTIGHRSEVFERFTRHEIPDNHPFAAIVAGSYASPTVLAMVVDGEQQDLVLVAGKSALDCQ